MGIASPTHDSHTRRLSISQDGGSNEIATEHTALQIGSRLGRYVILRRIGEGGMGIMYEAHDPGLGRNVAVKVLVARA